MDDRQDYPIPDIIADLIEQRRLEYGIDSRAPFTEVLVCDEWFAKCVTSLKLSYEFVAHVLNEYRLSTCSRNAVARIRDRDTSDGWELWVTVDGIGKRVDVRYARLGM